MPRAKILFCRACKLTHNEAGKLIIESATLTTSYNPIAIARDTMSQAFPDRTGVSAVALEVLFMQSLQEAYMAGVKDGVLLAYSKDVGEGEPMEATDGALPVTADRT